MEELAGVVLPYVRGRQKRGEIGQLTAKCHRGILWQFAEHAGCTPARLTRKHVERWLESLEHLAAGTRRNRYSVVARFCRWLHDEGLCPRDATKGMPRLREPRRVPRALQADAVTATLQACPDLRAQVIVVLMVQEGLRRGEVAKLQVGDFDLTHRMMRVEGKGGHQRVLPITDECYELVLRYLTQEGLRAGPLLRSYQFPTKGLHPETVSRIVRQAMQDAGVKRAPFDGVNPHALRHTAATDMLRSGAHIRDVQHALGHAHLQTTETYLPYLVGTLEQAMGGRRYGKGPSALVADLAG